MKIHLLFSRCRLSCVKCLNDLESRYSRLLPHDHSKWMIQWWNGVSRRATLLDLAIIVWSICMSPRLGVWSLRCDKWSMNILWSCEIFWIVEYSETCRSNGGDEQKLKNIFLYLSWLKSTNFAEEAVIHYLSAAKVSILSVAAAVQRDLVFGGTGNPLDACRGRHMNRLDFDKIWVHEMHDAKLQETWWHSCGWLDSIPFVVTTDERQALLVLAASMLLVDVLYMYKNSSSLTF